MSSLLDILWIQLYIGTDLLKTKWKYVSNTHLVQIPILILIKHYRKKNTKVLALVIFYKHGKKKINNTVQSFNTCNVYYYRQICLYWLFRFLEIKINWFKIGCTGSSKHNGLDYNNLLGIGIPDILLTFLSCHWFLKNNDSVVIFKCPNRMTEHYFDKRFIELECDEYHLKNFL